MKCTLRCCSSLLIGLLCSLGLKAQEPKPMYRKVPQEILDLQRQADSLYRVKQFKGAAEAFKSITQKQDNPPLDFWADIASCYSLAGELDSAAKYLQIGADKGYSMYAHMVAYFDLNNLRVHKQWPAICDKVRENRFKAMPRLNKELVMSLDTVTIRDQSMRWELMDATEKYGLKSEQANAIRKEIMRNDSANSIIVDRILSKHGWPHKSEIGEEGVIAMFLTVHHASFDFQKKHYNAIKEGVENKGAPPFLVCFIEDRMAVNDGKPQSYGTQIGYFQDTETNFVYPIHDVKNLDKRRAEYQLGNMDTYTKQFKIDWSLKYYNKMLPKVEKEIARNGAGG